MSETSDLQLISMPSLQSIGVLDENTEVEHLASGHGSSDRSLMVDPLSYFLFQPVFL